VGRAFLRKLEAANCHPHPPRSTIGLMQAASPFGSSNKNRPPFLATVAILLAIGCNQVQSLHQPAAEMSLADQVALVRAGSSDEIKVATAPVTDSDLDLLTDLPGLHALLLDHADSRISASACQKLAAHPQLTHLRIRGRGIDDAALAQITRLRTLRILNIPQADLTDSGLAALGRLPELDSLRLGSPRVTDDGLPAIVAVSTLQRLHLIDVPITDRGLKMLAHMRQLESLYLDGATFSNEAIDELFQARPNLHVHFNQQHHDRDPKPDAHP
jgi:hypothetical protein